MAARDLDSKAGYESGEIRVSSCEFVDHSRFLKRQDPPRNHINQHEQKFVNLLQTFEANQGVVDHRAPTPLSRVVKFSGTTNEAATCRSFHRVVVHAVRSGSTLTFHCSQCRPGLLPVVDLEVAPTGSRFSRHRFELDPKAQR